LCSKYEEYVRRDYAELRRAAIMALNLRRPEKSRQVLSSKVGRKRADEKELEQMTFFD